MNKVCYDTRWYSELIFWESDDYCEPENEENYKYKKLQFSR
jgi:hypothetical protein